MSPSTNPSGNTIVATGGGIQICIPPMNDAERSATLGNIAEAFQDRDVIVSSPDAVTAAQPFPRLSVVLNSASTPSKASLVPAAADYVNAWTASRDNKPGAILVLGPASSTVSSATMRRLALSILDGRDLVVPRYPVGAADAPMNASILYPLTRALFSNPLRYPLPIDVALSPRMAEVLAVAGQHLTASNQSGAFIWPVAEAVFARCSTCDVAGEPRHLPQPPEDELVDIFATYVGSIFADAQAKAAFWQRAQLTGTSHPRSLANVAKGTANQIAAADPADLIATFRHAFDQFRELWSLVLPPNSMLSFKKLSTVSTERFIVPEVLWARTVYDFLLAYRLQMVPRSQLFAAFAPLYRAWMASHILRSAGDAGTAEELVEDGARAFENDKPYLIARWRWPDRFNP